MMQKNQFLPFIACFFMWTLAISADDQLPPEYEIPPKHPVSVHLSPKYISGFVGLDLGGGFTQEPLNSFNASIHGGITFYYKDMQKSLFNSVLGFFLNTSLYTGVDFNVSKGRFTWAPKIGIVQLLGPIILGIETLIYTPSNFKDYDVQLYPHFGLSILNIFSLSVGPNVHIGGTRIESIPRWSASFTIRVPIELIHYFMGL